VAIPILYWMLECTGCGTRRVVYDCYLVFVGSNDNFEPGSGYSGPPLPERYSCAKRCAAPMREVGSIFEPQDRTMWLHDPHREIEMDRHQIDEWRRLIREAGLK